MSPFVLVGGALLVDLLLGDPETPLHPVRLMGRLASAVEGLARRGTGRGAPESGQRAKAGLVVRGALAWACVVGLSAAAAALLLWLARLAGAALGGALGGGAASGAATGAATGAAAASAAVSGAQVAEGLAAILLVYVSIAPRDLARHALRVRRALRNGGLEEGRRAVSMIVGRDVERLDEAGVVRACVESVAESAVDGVVAPLFWALVLGPVGAIAYRAINTLDSCWGYRDGRYLHFGRVAARADDVANWLPARLGFLAAIIASLVLGRDARGAARIGWRDRRKHESPNAAWLEACFAGALRVRLGGPAWYGGERLEKPFLGDDTRPVETADIGRSVALMYATALLFAAAGAGIASLAAAAMAR
jgi:adenosylcobinamide-phosphate synthase